MKTITITTLAFTTIGFLLADSAPEKPTGATEKPDKVVGTVEVEAGQQMPVRVSFVDKKAAEEKRTTNPVSVLVMDGKFEIPSLEVLPAGYLLTTTPCVRLKSVMVAGVDIRTLEGAQLSKLGTQTTLSTTDFSFGNLNFQRQDLTVTNGSTASGGLSAGFGNFSGNVTGRSLLGGVKFADCGGSAEGGAK